jgi:hypothetical protein
MLRVFYRNALIANQKTSGKNGFPDSKTAGNKGDPNHSAQNFCTNVFQMAA